MAFTCRYGHQDVYRILGRDPVARPLTALEYAVFVSCLAEHVEAEGLPRAVARAMATPPHES